MRIKRHRKEKVISRKSGEISAEAGVLLTVLSSHSVFPRWLSGEELACRRRRLRFDPLVGEIPWRREWQPTPVFMPGKSHGQRNLAGYSPRGRKEPDPTEWLMATMAQSPLGQFAVIFLWAFAWLPAIPLFPMTIPLHDCIPGRPHLFPLNSFFILLKAALSQTV